MTIAKFDFSELSEFDKDFLERLIDEQPKEAKKCLQKVANEYRKELRAQYRANTKKKTGNLLRGIKRGKVYEYKDCLQIRVKNTAPHAHLIEYGHKFMAWGHESDKRGFVHGKRIFEKTSFEGKFAKAVDKFVDDLLERGFS